MGTDNVEIHRERKGNDELVLFKLAEKRCNFFKEDCYYELQYKWYSETGVLGSEISLLTSKDVKSALNGLKQGESIFKFFQLFP